MSPRSSTAWTVNSGNTVRQGDGQSIVGYMHTHTATTTATATAGGCVCSLPCRYYGSHGVPCPAVEFSA